MTVFEAINSEDLDHLGHLQPPDWNDILPNLRFYVSSDFCYPVKLMADGHIAGIGAAILNKGSGWLANIIVDPAFRGQGFGTLITEKLMQILSDQGCKSQLLIATPLGEPVYRKLGFIPDVTYRFMQGPQLAAKPGTPIRPYTDADREALLQLDKHVSGEIRDMMLAPHLGYSMIYEADGILQGFFMPGLGEGMILAYNTDAGLALLHHKHAAAPCKTVLPETNEAGMRWMAEHGFTEVRRGLRMWQGEPVNFQAEKVFSRIGGHYA